ncbi:MAG: hypothetical protein R3A12_04920 [Ignavibacteria bacterium]
MIEASRISQIVSKLIVVFHNSSPIMVRVAPATSTDTERKMSGFFVP